jgi:ABC-2 type transport system permease protein
MKQMMTVFRFEFMTFAKSGTFIGITIFMVLLALIGPAVPRLIAFVGELNLAGERRMAVVDNTGLFDAETISAFVPPEVSLFNSLDAARAAVERGDYHYAVNLHKDSFTLYVTAMGVGAMNLGHNLSDMLMQLHRIDGFAALGVDPAQVQGIFDFVPAGEIMTIGPTGEITEDSAEGFFSNVLFSYVLSFVLYFSLMIGGSYIVTTVIREKSTKTMELLITSCKAGRLMNGKVFGVSGAVLVQLATMVGAAAVSINLFGDASMLSFTFDPYIMGMLIVFFFLGFLMYAYVYAALSSTVSRLEDANSIQTLPMLLIMAGFFAAIFGLANPGAGWINVVSHIPLFAPFIMFMRICLGTVAVWEVMVSIAAQGLTIGIIAWLSARIYRMGTLMYGNKPKIRDLLAAFR